MIKLPGLTFFLKNKKQTNKKTQLWLNVKIEESMIEAYFQGELFTKSEKYFFPHIIVLIVLTGENGVIWETFTFDYLN